MNCAECGRPLPTDSVTDLCLDCKMDMVARLHENPIHVLVEDHFDWPEAE